MHVHVVTNQAAVFDVTYAICAFSSAVVCAWMPAASHWRRLSLARHLSCRQASAICPVSVLCPMSGHVTPVNSPSSIMSVMCPVASVRLLFQLDDKTSLHTTDNGEVVLRLTILSLQTAPVGMRTVPMFDYQSKHLLRTKYVRSLN